MNTVNANASNNLPSHRQLPAVHAPHNTAHTGPRATIEPEGISRKVTVRPTT